MNKITIGARGSKLSLAYVSKVKNLIMKNVKKEDASIDKMIFVKIGGNFASWKEKYGI